MLRGEIPQPPVRTLLGSQIDSVDLEAGTLSATYQASSGYFKTASSSLFDDDHQDTARRVLNQGLRNRAAPPTLQPIFAVLVAQHDQVGADAVRVFNELVNGITFEQFAGGINAGRIQLRNTFTQYF